MAVSKLQATQAVLYDVLSELANAQNEQLDSILSKVNTALKVPGMLSLGAGLVVNVANTTLTKPNGTKVRLVLGDVDIGGLSGSVDFATGTGSGDVQTVSLPILTASQWYKVGFEIRSDKKIYVVFGTIGASEALAGFPNWSEVGVSLGYVSLQVNGTGDGWATPTSASINQFGGGGGGGQADHTLLTGRTASNQHPTTSVSTVTAEFTGDSELTATEDEVQKALLRLAKYDSILDWVDGGIYRVGNIVKATGTNGTTVYRCITAHTASGTFDNAKFELIISAQDHNTLANKNAASAHPTSSIDTNTGDFSGELTTAEDTSQKAFVRLEQFGSVFNWADVKDYRVGNIVKATGTNGTSLYRCIEAHTSSGSFDNAKFELVVSAQDHNTLANRDVASAHNADNIATETTNFDDFLRTSEDDSQKVFNRLNSYSSIGIYDETKTYRINNIVIYDFSLWTCRVDNVTGVFDPESWKICNQGNERSVTVTSPSGQTVFDLTFGDFTIHSSQLEVFINGIKQPNNSSYWAITGDGQVTFVDTVPQNAVVTFRLKY